MMHWAHIPPKQGCLFYAFLYSITFTTATVSCTPAPAHAILAPTSFGDLVDRITILRIKQKRLSDPVKLDNINNELRHLEQLRSRTCPSTKELAELETTLCRVNEKLWDLEDAVRSKERQEEFDDVFATLLARILENNDERARIKKAINVIGNSPIIEEKSYGWCSADASTCNDHAKPAALLYVATSAGDLIDRMTILTIKKARMSDARRRENVHRELKLLEQAYGASVATTPDVERLAAELRAANEEMWDIQDRLRLKWRAHAFDDEFKELGRRVYRVNDARCAAKRALNTLLASAIVEEKCYATY